MKVSIDKNNTVFNIIHDNGVQTSVKVSPSGHYTSDQIERDKPLCTNKNKYTVIVSSSKGCQLSCTFCHLTQNNKQYETLTADDIKNCVIEAVEYVNNKIDLSGKYIKLCYMGEGEAVLQMNKTNQSAKEIVGYVLENNLAKGLDGVDISTTLPKNIKNLKDKIVELNSWFKEKGVELNPYNHSEPNRSIVRLFYSLHHYDNSSRKLIVPNTLNVLDAINALSKIQESGINIVTHYMFMSDINDSSSDVENLVSFVNNEKLFKNSEFRILRLNSTDNIVESERMANIIKYLENTLNVKKFKVQFSAGEDVKAACGMFI